MSPTPPHRPSADVLPPTRLARMVRPMQEFVQQAQSGGIVLLVITVIALIIANTGGLADLYEVWSRFCTNGPLCSREYWYTIGCVQDGCIRHRLITHDQGVVINA